MRTRKIGTLDVTVIGLGCSNFGRELDADGTRQAIHTALDHGINFFDTADVYGLVNGSSETLMGPVLKPRRDQVIIATKFGRVFDETRPGGGRPEYVKAAAEDSLRRLQTDYLDLMQMHIPDPETPVEETLGALGELVAAGKVREIGGSNFDAGQLRAMAAAADRAGQPRFVSTQGDYSLLHHHGPAPLLAECARIGASFLPYRPLYDGLLTGKYLSGAPALSGTRFERKDQEYRAAVFSDRNMTMVAGLGRFAEERGHTLLELAVSWLLANPVIPSVIAGVSSARQIPANVAAAGWVLAPGELAEIEEITALSD